MDNTTIICLVAVGGIVLFAMSRDKTEKVCEPSRPGTPPLTIMERAVQRADVLEDHPGRDEGEVRYPIPANIPQETRPDDRALMEFFRSMTERYSDRRTHTKDLVGGINKRFASICSQASYYLEDNQFSYEQLADIQSEVKILENMAITLEAVTTGVTEETAFDLDGELWQEKDLDLLVNTMDNYRYILEQLVKAGIIEEHCLDL